MAEPAKKAVVGEINTLLGQGSEFEGKLTFEGTVRIDGKLSGEVFSDDVLVIGEGAFVQAEIDVGEIIVNPGPMRLMMIVNAISPRFMTWLLRKAGVDAMFRRQFEANRRRESA